jgi:lipopolysaccharide transport system ATP-binding protein
LEPEILIIDEVLAVGDAAFQKKCLGKMDDVASEGRTVLFVSHQFDMVRSLCERCVLLDDGILIRDGESREIIDFYLQDSQTEISASSFLVEEDEQIPLQVTAGRLMNELGQNRADFDAFEPIILEIEYVIRKPRLDLLVNFELRKNATTIFLSFDTDALNGNTKNRSIGKYKSQITIPAPLLKPGKYTITFNTGIANTTTYQRLEEIMAFEVDILSRPSSLLSFSRKRPGVVATVLPWNTELLNK